MPNFTAHTRHLWGDLRTRKIYLACSGGVDSMVLFHSLNALKVDLHVIHVNYQLRGEASDLDASFVQSVCDQHSVPCEIRRIDLRKQLENGGNLQNEARKVRYGWFDEILAEDSNNRIALAHHQDDQMETFFLNLARKSGVLGLACMKHEHKAIVRPLLDFSKTELLLYAKNHSIQWREDKSNQSNAYKRNRLRNEFIPFLLEHIPDLGDSILNVISHFQSTQSDLETKVRPLVHEINASNKLATSLFEELSEWEQVELLRQIDLPASYAERMVLLTERGKRITLQSSKYECIVRDENYFAFLQAESESYELLIETVDLLPDLFSKYVAYFDESKIEGDLKLRRWKIGDRISPIGMNGSQLVSDVIKDAKISAADKQIQLIVHDEKSILWCVGLKISRNARVSDQSKKILRCSIIASKVEE